MKRFTPLMPLLGLCLLLVAPARAQTTAGEAVRSGDVLTLRSGPFRLEFTERAAWTIKRLFLHDRLAFSHTGAFQTVVRMKKPADQPQMDPWIGTGHGKEVISSIHLEVDGRKMELADGLRAPGTRFTLVKDSRLGPYRHLARVSLDGRQIREEFEYEVLEDDSQVDFMYAFMHCFPKSMDQWLALKADGQEESGAFKTDNSFSLKRDMHWAAVYSTTDGQGLLFRYPEPYAGMKGISNAFWNRPRDNKLYFKPDFPRGVGKKFSYQLSIEPFTATPDAWQPAVRTLTAAR